MPKCPTCNCWGMFLLHVFSGDYLLSLQNETIFNWRSLWTLQYGISDVSSFFLHFNAYQWWSFLVNGLMNNHVLFGSWLGFLVEKFLKSTQRSRSIFVLLFGFVERDSLSALLIAFTWLLFNSEIIVTLKLNEHALKAWSCWCESFVNGVICGMWSVTTWKLWP